MLISRTTVWQEFVVYMTNEEIVLYWNSWHNKNFAENIFTKRYYDAEDECRMHGTETMKRKRWKYKEQKIIKRIILRLCEWYLVDKLWLFATHSFCNWMTFEWHRRKGKKAYAIVVALSSLGLIILVTFCLLIFVQLFVYLSMNDSIKSKLYNVMSDGCWVRLMLKDAKDELLSNISNKVVLKKEISGSERWKIPQFLSRFLMLSLFTNHPIYFQCEITFFGENETPFRMNFNPIPYQNLHKLPTKWLHHHSCLDWWWAHRSTEFSDHHRIAHRHVNWSEIVSFKYNRCMPEAVTWFLELWTSWYE